MSKIEFYQGWFPLKNREKYIGKQLPFFRSLYEFRVMNYFDLNKNVIRWSSENIIIPYKLPHENKIRRYIVDFYVEIKNTDGVIKKFLVEVKPLDFSVKPQLPKSNRITKSYKIKAINYIINFYKWQAAQKYCESRGLEFKVLTEKEIYQL